MRKPHSSFKLQEAACVVNSRELRVKWTVSDYRRVYQGLVLAAHREQQFQHDDSVAGNQRLQRQILPRPFCRPHLYSRCAAAQSGTPTLLNRWRARFLLTALVSRVTKHLRTCFPVAALSQEPVRGGGRLLYYLSDGLPGSESAALAWLTTLRMALTTASGLSICMSCPLPLTTK